MLQEQPTMAGSVLNTSLVPLGLAAPPMLAAAPSAAAPVWRAITFHMQTQLQTEWCWAAVTASVSQYYLAMSTWTQCSMVNDQLTQTTCCVNGSSPACNQPYFLDLSLTRSGNLAAFAAGAASMAQVQAEINANRPLGVRIGWPNNGGGHFVIIEGYSTANDLDIQDPWFGQSTVDYNHFQTSYQGTGAWTHSYWTN